MPIDACSRLSTTATSWCVAVIVWASKRDANQAPSGGQRRAGSHGILTEYAPRERSVDAGLWRGCDAGAGFVGAMSTMTTSPTPNSPPPRSTASPVSSRPSGRRGSRRALASARLHHLHCRQVEKFTPSTTCLSQSTLGWIWYSLQSFRYLVFEVPPHNRRLVCDAQEGYLKSAA